MGMAKADITPKLGCLLYGYPSVRHADRVADRLEVGVIALNNGAETLLMISNDICAVNLDICEDFRTKIAEATGVKKANILHSCIHTHSGPVTKNAAGWGTADMDYIYGALFEGTVDAAHKAIDSMQLAVMGVGTSESMAGINRREIDANGNVILGQNPDGPYDPTLIVVSFKSLNGQNLGSFVHFAVHPTVAGANLSITRDWPGYMIDRITEITGAPCMYINGAEGDIGPRLSNGRTIADDSYLPEIGNIAADDAEKAYNKIEEFIIPELKIKSGMILFPFAEIPTLEEVEQKIIDMGDPDKLVETDILKHAQLCKLKALYESGEQVPTEKVVEQTVISIGGIAMVPFPFEAFCNFALALREKSPYENTILLGLTGGSYGYLPTEDQIPLGGYEIESFFAASVPPFSHKLGEHLISENVNLLNELFRK